MGDVLGAVTRTFLFTDLEGSTRLWEDEPHFMRDAVARHDEIVRKTLESNGGVVFASGGDGFAAAFEDAASGVRAALEVQLALVAETWPVSRPLKARMALHTDAVEVRDDNFFGPPLNRCARLMAAAHGSQVVCSDATAALARNALHEVADLVDLGDHRLRDLARPIRVYQIVHRALPRDFPPLRSLDAFPTNLPAQVTAFVGRDTELREVAKALEDWRVVTLTGVGGVGKTRLAVQVAADVLPAYSDGAWMVELGGVADVEAVDEAVAVTLGVQPQPGQTLRESLLGFLRSKRLLLVIDNCEHLLEPIADLVEDALALSPNVAVLATSREAMGVVGERVLGVRSLAVPGADDPLEALSAADAVRLFADRAAAVRAGFTVGPDNAAAVVQLCRRLDGIPLAIELAAARVRAMSPAEIAARLDQRFRLLTGGARRTANRHQTLRRAIDWSWDLLDEEERSLLRRLAVCVGGFDLGAAEAIGAGGTIDAFAVDDILARLVDKSLVVAEDLGNVTRYRMLETIREYSLERLDDAGEVDDVRERHASHYAAFAEEAGRGLKGRDERAWLERVDAEIDNLRLVVTWSAESSHVDLAMRVVAALALNGLRFETSVASWAEIALSAPDAAADPRRGVAMAMSAWAEFRRGNQEGAQAMVADALAATGCDTDEAAAWRCRILSRVTEFGGLLARPAPDEAAEWLELSRRVNDLYEESEALAITAVFRMYAGEDPVPEAEEAVRVARRLGNPTVLAYCLAPLAHGVALTDVDRALPLLEEAIVAADGAGNDFAAWVSGLSLGQILAKRGDHAAAVRSMLEAASRSERGGHRSYQAICMWGIVGGLAVLGEEEPAATLCGWLGPLIADMSANPVMADDLNRAVERLPESLGQARYDELTAAGSMLDDREAIDFATEAVERAIGPLG